MGGEGAELAGGGRARERTIRPNIIGMYGIALVARTHATPKRTPATTKMSVRSTSAAPFQYDASKMYMSRQISMNAAAQPLA